MSAKIETSGNDRIPTFQFALAYLIFFVSGCAALVYEISWSRQIGLLFGHTIHAASVVLASYFSGMAIGYLIGARWSTKIPPLIGYAIAEFVVAGWALLIPTILVMSESPSVAAYLSSPSFFWQLLTRVAFCMLLLLPATISLGATLPMMAEFIARQQNKIQASEKTIGRVSLAYAINTLGALTGVLLATFYLLVTIGVRSSSFLAAGLSAFCAIVAIILHRSARGAEQQCVSPPEKDFLKASNELALQRHTAEPTQLSSRFCLWLAAISGFGTLALEVLYVRLFSLVFHNSTYTFGAVLTVFLLALSAGAALASIAQKRFRLNTLIAWACIFGAISTVVSVVVFVKLTDLDYFSFGNSFATYLCGVFGLVTLVVFPPITFLGALLPLVWKAASKIPGRSVGSTVGRMTSANTLAAALGSLAASFLLLPILGLWQAFVMLGILFFAISVAFLWNNHKVRLAVFAVVFAFFAVQVIQSPSQSKSASKREEIVQRWNSPYGWVDVVRGRKDGALKVSQNLHYRFGATGRNSKREFRQAHLPILLHSDPRNILFLGLGTGLTAGGAVPHENLESIEVVELIPEVVDAARLLFESNNNIVDHSKTVIHVDDARHFLLANEQRFDVIVADLFVPWESETGYLYTVEHYEIAKRRLNSNGLFCQWLPLYQMGTREFELIADSFAEVFPNSTIWWGKLDARRPIIALVGSQKQIKLDKQLLDERISKIKSSKHLFDPNLRSAKSIIELFAGNWQQKHDLLNTDEHPRVEFQTPVSHRDRTLLQKQVLERYFRQVLNELPFHGLAIEPLPNADPEPSISHANEVRRAWQFFVLFGTSID